MSCASFVSQPEVQAVATTLYFMYVPDDAWRTEHPPGHTIECCSVAGCWAGVYMQDRFETTVFDIPRTEDTDLDTEIAMNVWLELTGKILPFVVCDEGGLLVKLPTTAEEMVRKHPRLFV